MRLSSLINMCRLSVAVSLLGTTALAQGLPTEAALAVDRGVVADRFDAGLAADAPLPAPASETAQCEALTTGGGGAQAAAGEAREDVLLDLPEIEFGGVSQIDPAAVAAIAARYQGAQVPIYATIDGVIADVTALYVAQGLILTRVFVPPEQDVAAGVLRFEVVEVTVEGLDLVENGAPRVGNNTVLRGLEGAPFRLPVIEAGLEQINRLPSFDAVIDILPGADETASRVVICADVARPVRGSITLNNSGSDATGRNQIEARIAADDLLGFYEQWSLRVSRDTAFEQDGFGSELIAGDVSVPWGAWLMRAGLSRSAYASTVEGAAQNFVSEGHQTDATLGIERVVAQSQTSRTVVSGGLDYSRKRSAIAGVRLQVASRSFAGASLTLDHSRSIGGTGLSARLTLRQGLAQFGAGPVAELFRSFDLVFCHKGETSWH